MSLQDFQQAVELISGVSSTTRSNGQLTVEFLANPSNYSNTLRQLKKEYNITQVDRGNTSDHSILVYESLE